VSGHPWLGIGLVLGVLGALLGGLRLLHKVVSPHPEVTRKLMHIGMGLVTLGLPWLFNDFWPVILLAALSIVLLLSLRLVKALKQGFGTVLGGVDRVSLGEIYFPLAVAILFGLYLRSEENDPAARVLLYCIPVLLLTLADAAAALVGIRYGQVQYSTADGHKSAEGSVAFLACAFLLVHVPLLLFTQTGPAECLLIALLMALLATAVEAIAWNGLDNLVLPLTSFLLLKVYLALDVDALLMRLAFTLALLTVVLVFRYLTTLQGSALLGAFLVGYVCWALGGWEWMLAPVILYFTYSYLAPRTPVSTRRHHTVHAVACVASTGLFWLFLAIILNRQEFLYLFTLAFAAHLAMIGVASVKLDYPRLSGAAAVSLCVAISWPLMFGPYLALRGLDACTLCCSLVALPGIALATTAFYVIQPEITNCPADTPRWLRQGLLATLGSLLGLLPLYLMQA
jgi:phytol kinase